MVNVDYVSPSLWLGMAVATSGLVLYTFKMRNARGTRDLDIVTSSLLVLVGGILTLQGWRLDPILMLSEGVLACVGVYYIAQTVELRKQLMDTYDGAGGPQERWRDDFLGDDADSVRSLAPPESSTVFRGSEFYDQAQRPGGMYDRGSAYQYDDEDAGYRGAEYEEYGPQYGASSGSGRGRFADVEARDEQVGMAAESGYGGAMPGAQAAGRGERNFAGGSQMPSFSVQSEVPQNIVPASQWAVAPSRGVPADRDCAGGYRQQRPRNRAQGDEWGRQASPADDIRDEWSR